MSQKQLALLYTCQTTTILTVLRGPLWANNARVRQATIGPQSRLRHAYKESDTTKDAHEGSAIDRIKINILA